MANSYNSNQGKGNCNVTELRRNPNDVQISSQLMDTTNQNLLFSSSQGTTSNPLLSYQGASFSGMYGSPGFNSSLTGYENNLQWLTDNRIQNQHNQLPGSLVTDKSISTTTHSLPPTTSHSCCVNRFSMLDSLGMGSPLPTEQVKSSCDVPGFQSKSNLSMNMIDPIQSWLNLQIPAQINNQQYCKYSERSMAQNYNIPVSMPSQVNLPLIDQSDLKQNDMCIQSPDTCFENVHSNNKHIDNSAGSLKQSFPVENKQIVIQENANMFKQQSSYQASLMSKDWKSTFQTMQNYISSPNMFSAVNESQENILFAQYSMAPTSSYYSPSDNYSPFVNKNTTCMAQSKTSHNRNENNITMQNSFIDQNHINSQTQNNANSHYLSKQIKENGKMQSTLRSNNGNDRLLNYNGSLSDCCQEKKSQGKAIGPVENSRFALRDGAQENKNNGGNLNSATVDPDNQSDKRHLRSSEAVSSESDESNIIVEESDDLGEIESEISIDEIKKSYQASERCASEVLLRCLVCNTATSPHTPANQFIHMNDSFPLTTSSKTPIRTKLEQILPIDLQQYLKLHNSFMCRRCVNLIETVEVLEVKLTTAKQTISDNFSKTVHLLMPAVERLLQDNKNVSKPLPSNEADKTAKSFVEVEMQSIENECSEDEKAVITSDSESTVEFKCSYCCKILSSQKYLNLHLQQHTKDFSFYCERCGKGFQLKSILEKHLNWHNGDAKEVQILCEICGEIFSSKHLFNSHMLKSHSGDSNFKCEICGKGFTRKVSLEIHSHKHTGIRSFICEYCGHTFSSGANLKGHIKVCTKDLTHKCDDCGKGFVTDSQLARHKSQHSGIYKLTCSVCGKGFNKPSDLSYHMLSHSSEKQFKCTDCDKAFKTMGNLNYHSKVVHKEEKIFKCTVCGRSFAHQNLLSDHMNSHTNEKPYVCGQCDESFVHQTTFITHLKKHTSKVKLKTCQVCGKSIKTRMSVHMRTHTGEKPYKCTYCPLAFTVGISLKKHIQAKHCKT